MPLEDFFWILARPGFGSNRYLLGSVLARLDFSRLKPSLVVVVAVVVFGQREGGWQSLNRSPETDNNNDREKKMREENCPLRRFRAATLHQEETQHRILYCI